MSSPTIDHADRACQTVPETAGGPGTAVRVRGVTRRFGTTVALDGIDLDIAAGSIHALVGENGAGKSTLLGLMAGRIRPSSGSVHVFGAELAYGDPRQARRAGVAAIYQELTVIPHLTAAANVFLGSPIDRGGWLLRRSARRRFAELAGRVGAHVDPDMRAGKLSVAQQQLVEVMRALHLDARVILFDEPTAPLSPAERQLLLALMRELRDEGRTIVFVSHDLEEVLEVSDRVSVFRDGRLSATRDVAQWTKPSVVREMLGPEGFDAVQASAARRAGGDRSAAAAGAGRAVLRVGELHLPGVLKDVSFELAEGEIVGVAGLVGAGRTTLLRALAGCEPRARGRLEIRGQQQPWPHRTRLGLARGLALIPEDRKLQGLVPGMSAASNVLLPTLGSVSRFGWLTRRGVQRHAAEACEPFGFDPRRLRETARNLSGGNQQKLLLARWGHRDLVALLADEPTRGIDLGARAQIVGALRGLAASGTAVLLVSSDHEEILDIADRVLVLSRGRVVKTFDNRSGDLTESQILDAAFDLEDSRVKQ